MPPIIAARAVAAGYGEIAVARGLELEVNRGEVVALLGPNGAGKTTVLSTLAGELEPLAGQVFWNGKRTIAPLHVRAKAGMRFVTEERSVFMGLTAGENLRLGGGSPEKALELFPELEPLLRRKAGLLSGGEQQMLTLARALSSDPDLLLADELSLGLAPRVVTRLLQAVRQAAERGVAVLLVEQQVRHALEVADRGYVMRRGRIVMSGTAGELLAQMGEIQASYLAGTDTDAAADAAAGDTAAVTDAAMAAPDARTARPRTPASPRERVHRAVFYALCALGAVVSLFLASVEVGKTPPIEIGKERSTRTGLLSTVQVDVKNVTREPQCPEIRVAARTVDDTDLEEQVASPVNDQAAIPPGLTATYRAEFTGLTEEEYAEKLRDFVAYAFAMGECP